MIHIGDFLQSLSYVCQPFTNRVKLLLILNCDLYLEKAHHILIAFLLLNLGEPIHSCLFLHLFPRTLWISDTGILQPGLPSCTKQTLVKTLKRTLCKTKNKTA